MRIWSDEAELLLDDDDSLVSLCELTAISGEISYCVLFIYSFLGLSSNSLVSWENSVFGLQLATEYQIHLKAHSLPRNVPLSALATTLSFNICTTAFDAYTVSKSSACPGPCIKWPMHLRKLISV